MLEYNGTGDVMQYETPQSFWLSGAFRSFYREASRPEGGKPPDGIDREVPSEAI